MDALITWLQSHQILLWMVCGGSLVLFFATLVFIPVFVARLPADYFTRQPAATLAAHKTALTCIGLLCKNALGILLILMGIAMLVLPGQGVITIVIGLALVDFPGKYRLQQRLVRQPAVFNALNWIRKKSGRTPLLSP